MQKRSLKFIWMFQSKDGETPVKRKKTGGRPKDTIKSEAFQRVIEYIECNDEQITVGELIEKMSEYMSSDDCEPYSFKHMKCELKAHFADRIVFTEINGKLDVVTFRLSASNILHDFSNETAEWPEWWILPDCRNSCQVDTKGYKKCTTE